MGIVVDIVTSIGVIGTLILGFYNLFSLRRSELITRQFNIKSSDYESRKEYLLTKVSEFIALLDVSEITFTTDKLDEYGDLNRRAQEHLYLTETCYYNVLLFLNMKNNETDSLEKILTDSMEKFKKIYNAISHSSFAFASLNTHGERFGDKLQALGHDMLQRNMDIYIKILKEFEDNKKKIVEIMRKYFIVEEALILTMTNKKRGIRE